MSTHERRILVVDDDPSILGMLQYALEEEGFVVETATGGLEAVVRARRRPHPHLILLDVLLPHGIDGYGVCLALRSDAETRNIPVLFMSAYEPDDVKLTGMTMSRDDFLGKPFSLDELNTKIAHMLRLAPGEMRRPGTEPTQETQTTTQERKGKG